MPGVILPDYVAEQYEREAQADRQIGKAMAFDARLKEYDRRLELVWIHENATAAGLVPARWHVHVHVEGAPDLYIPITGPEGEYREPDERVIEELWGRDLHRHGDVVTYLRERRAREQAAREREQALAREQRADNVAADYTAALRVSDDRGLEKRVWGRG